MLVAELSALAIEGIQVASAATFGLTAETIGGVVDETRSDLVVNSVSTLPDNTTRVPVDLAGVLRTTFWFEDNVRLLIRPLPGHTPPHLASPTIDSTVTSGPTSPLSFDPYASAQREPIVLPTQGTLAASLSDGIVSIAGDFELTFWDVTVTFETASSSTTIQTGLETEKIAAPPPGVQRGVERTTAREAFLSVTNGTLSFAAEPANRLFVAMADVAGLTDSSSIELRGATGLARIRGVDLDLDDDDLVIRGRGEASLVPNADGKLSATIEGKPNQIVVDGQLVHLPDPIPLGWRWAFVGAWFVLLLVGYLAFQSRRRRKLFHRLDDLMAKSDYVAAIPVAQDLRRFNRFAEDAIVAEGVSLIRLGRDQEALQLLLDTPRRGRQQPGRNFLLARISAAQGRIQEAERWLTECLVAAPSYAIDAATDPVLAPIVKAARAKHGTDVGGYA